MPTRTTPLDQRGDQRGRGRGTIMLVKGIGEAIMTKSLTSWQQTAAI